MTRAKGHARHDGPRSIGMERRVEVEQAIACRGDTTLNDLVAVALATETPLPTVMAIEKAMADGYDNGEDSQ